MKLTFTDDFERRFATAAKNGSRLAADILKAIKTPDNVADGVRADYFTTVKVHHGSGDGFTQRTLKITYCSKDFSNANNPEHGSPVGMWRRENRSTIDLPRLVGLFKSLDANSYTSAEYQQTAEILSIDEPLKVVTLKGMANIKKLYHYANYSSNDGTTDTLWNSCMRYEETAEVAGDFYANFCGASIVGVIGAVSGAVYGRAILWPEIDINGDKGAFLDRVYTTHDCLRFLIYEHAKKEGVKFRKWRNDYASKQYFVRLAEPDNAIEARVTISVPQVKWHKYGSPYTDTFSWVVYDDGHFFLANYDSTKAVVRTDRTGERGEHIRSICPVCGRVHNGRYGILCDNCSAMYMKNTIVGLIYTGRLNRKGEPILPKKFKEATERVENL